MCIDELGFSCWIILSGSQGLWLLWSLLLLLTQQDQHHCRDSWVTYSRAEWGESPLLRSSLCLLGHSQKRAGSEPCCLLFLSALILS